MFEQIKDYLNQFSLLVVYFILDHRGCSSYFVVFCTMQFYTFLETALVTLSLLPHFIAFFSDVEIPGTPGALATTFLTFGKYIL